MYSRSQPNSLLNELASESNIIKDENYKLFILFQCVINKISNYIKQKKIITTEDVFQKIFFDTSKNFYEYIKNVNWYTKYETNVYTNEYFNTYYNDLIIKQSYENKKYFIKDINILMEFNEDSFTKYLNDIKLKDETVINNLIESDNENINEINKNLNNTIQNFPKRNYNNLDEIVRTIYVLKYNNKKDLIYDYLKLENSIYNVTDKFITYKNINNNILFFLYIKYNKKIHYNKNFLNGEICLDEIFVGIKAKDNLLKISNLISINELKNNE